MGVPTLLSFPTLFKLKNLKYLPTDFNSYSSEQENIVSCGETMVEVLVKLVTTAVKYCTVTKFVTLTTKH